jgi:hypothetical protein
MINRRGFLIGAGVLAGGAWAQAPGVPGDNDLVFDVSRNGSRIGSHKLRFSRSAETLTVTIDAEFRVGFGPITLFRYAHRGVETWQGGRFMRLETTTNHNGTHRSVLASRQAGGVLIRATGAPDRVDSPDTLPLTHWAIEAMSAPVFNPETGENLAEQARHLGPATVQLADGAHIPATRFALTGETSILDYYDNARVWAGLQAKAKDGSSIDYRRV